MAVCDGCDRVLAAFVARLYAKFRDLFFAYLEINPLGAPCYGVPANES